MTVPGLDPTLANVIADTLAHHEAAPELESLVCTDESHRGAWLDFERAGRIVADAFVQIDPPVGWTPTGPIFALRATSTACPPDVESAAETAIGPPRRADTDPTAGGHPSPPPDSDARNLDVTPESVLGRVLGLARELMPEDAQRHDWLRYELGRLGRGPSLHDLQILTTVECLGLVERLSNWSAARARNARRRGIHIQSPGAQR